MGTYYETTTVFNYSWHQVARAFWNRYPNPQSSHVLTEDTISREVRDGKLYTRRLLSKTNPVPKWGERFYGAKSVKIVEDSVLDPEKRTLTTFTRNIGFKKVMSVDETVEYMEGESGKTVVRRSAVVNSQVFGFSRAIRALGVERFKSNCKKASLGFNFVLARMFPNQATNAIELAAPIPAAKSESKMGRVKNAAASVYNFSKNQAGKVIGLFSVRN